MPSLPPTPPKSPRAPLPSARPPLISLPEILQILGSQADPQQSEVITAPLDGPRLVIAGAGAGKTSTMTMKAIYHIANGHARPSQILGLTFTNKAAEELRERVAGALERIRTYFTSRRDQADLSPAELARCEQICSHCQGESNALYTPPGDLLPLATVYEQLEQVQVFTYDSYAIQVLSRLGGERGSKLLTEASKFSLAHELVLSLTEPLHLDPGDPTGRTLAEHTLELAGQVSNQLLDIEFAGDAQPGWWQALVGGDGTLEADRQTELLAPLGEATFTPGAEVSLDPTLIAAENPYDLITERDLSTPADDEEKELARCLRRLQERLLALSLLLDSGQPARKPPRARKSAEEKAHQELEAAAEAALAAEEEPPVWRGPKRHEPKPSAVLKEVREKLIYRCRLLKLVFLFRRRMRELGYRDYSTVTAAAYRAVRASLHLSSGQALRSEFKLILLDEFQDTSVAQLELFSTLFKGMSVVAVGDPNQGIYGWRGASEQPIKQFFEKFLAAPDQKNDEFVVAHRNPDSELTGDPYLARRHGILTTYRNLPQVLAVAQALISPTSCPFTREELAEIFPTLWGPWANEEHLAARRLPTPNPHLLDLHWRCFEPPAPAAKVKALSSHAREGGRARVYWARTDQDEAAFVAEQCARVLARRAEIIAAREKREREGLSVDSLEKPPTCAILMRSVKQSAQITQALDARGIPYSFYGQKTLLHDNAVNYLLAALGVSCDPLRGADALTLLMRIGLGAKDLHLLSRATEKKLSAALRLPLPRFLLSPAEQARSEQARSEQQEAAPSAKSPTAEEYARELSPVARSRVRILAEQIERIRALQTETVEETLRQALTILDLDLVPHFLGSAPHAQALSCLLAEARKFQQENPTGGIAEFLHWVDVVKQQTAGLDSPAEEMDPHSVQIMTIHAAKGLEWDYVILPQMRLSCGSPKNARMLKNYEFFSSAPLKSSTALPYDLTRDAPVKPLLSYGQDWLKRHGGNRNYPLPRWEEREAGANNDLVWAYMRAQGEAQLTEERNIYYVAVTRAREEIICGGAAWKVGETGSSCPNFYLLQAAQVAGTSLQVQESDGTWQEANPARLKEIFFQLRDGFLERNGKQDLAQAQWPSPLAPGGRTLFAAASKVRTERENPQLEKLSAALAQASDEEQRQRVRQHAFTLGGPKLATAVRLLQERTLAARSRSEVYLPARLATTKAKLLARDPAAFASQLRRPLPQPPARGAEIGSLLHDYAHQYLSAKRSLAGYVRATGTPLASRLLPLAQSLQRVVERAGWEYVESESEYTHPLRFAGGEALDLVARIDAVFRDPHTGQFLIVDWKTDGGGRNTMPGPELAPASAFAALKQAPGYAYQVRLYSLLYAHHHGLEPAQVAGKIVFLRGEAIFTDSELAADLPASLAELEAQIRAKIEP